MARLRANKSLLKQWIRSEDWQEHIEQIMWMEPKEVVSPLLSFVLLDDDMKYRSAYILGHCVAMMADNSLEDARNIMRRLMWHMNEESGNIGWGIPEVMAEVCVQSERIAKDFSSIVLSYIIDTGRDDNYCDHDILRRSCYFAVGRLVSARPKLCVKIIPWLMKSIAGAEHDVICRMMAIWALAQFPKESLPTFEIFSLLRQVEQSNIEILDGTCRIFDGKEVQTVVVRDILKSSTLL